MRIWFALLFCCSNLLGGVECQVDEFARQRLIRHLAWYDQWQGISYLEDRSLNLYFVAKNGRLVWYLPKWNVSVLEVHQRQRTRLISGHCNSRPNTPLTCLQNRLFRSNPDASFEDFVFGNPTPTKIAITQEEVNACTVSESEIQHWSPSPPSPLKRQMMDKLAAEARKQGDYWGTTSSVYCNDFNVDDPRVFALVNVVDEKRKNDQILITLDLGCYDGDCVFTNRVVERDLADDGVVRMVLDNSLKLYP